LFEVKESILEIAKLLSPFIPDSAEKIIEVFSAEEIKKAEVLFEKIEKVNKDPEVKEIMEGVGQAKFEDWEKLDLRVAEIKSAEDIEGADKLWKLTLDVGELGERTICAGIKEFYSQEKLIGKKIIYFSNLKPRKMRGIESQGMLLAASNEDNSKVVLVNPKKEVSIGSEIIFQNE
jgi:methionyl-tRNA synthetase